MPHDWWRVIFTATILFLVLLSLRHNTNRSQTVRSYKSVWNDFLEMVDVLGLPLYNYYSGPLTYHGGAIWESLRKELVFRARSVLLMEKKGGPTGFSESALEEIRLAREWLARVHSVALKYQFAEKKWDAYFDAAREELEKDSK